MDKKVEIDEVEREILTRLTLPTGFEFDHPYDNQLLPGGLWSRLPIPVQRKLERLKIRSIRDLRMREGYLITGHNQFGHRSLMKVRTVLAEAGFWLLDFPCLVEVSHFVTYRKKLADEKS